MLKKLNSRTKVAIASLFVLSLACSFILSPYANAISEYDNTLTTTSELHLSSSTLPCAQEGDTLSWASILLDANKWDGSWGQYLFGADSATSRSAFSTALDNGTGWAVSQHNYVPGSTNGGAGGGVFDDTINIQFSPSESAYVDFGTIGTHTYAYMRTTGSAYVYNVKLSMRKDTTGEFAGVCRPFVNQTARWTGDKDINWINYNLGGQNFSIGTDWQSSDSGFVTTAKPLFINTTIDYPQGYEGEQVGTTVPSPRNYVALGDSFSSGEGNPPFESGTDIGSGVDKNLCHRSSSAYPYLLTSSQYLNLTNFAACSGATTDNVINGGAAEGAWNESPQVSALSQNTSVVTLTIGGNDVGFADFATACTTSLCDFTTQAYQDIHDKIANNLPSKLTNVYDAIDQATSSSARIYVLGYPNILPSQMPTGPSSACWPFNGGANDPDPAQNNGAAAYAVQTQLNSAIEQAVNSLGSSKFQYVNPNANNSPFLGHDWCSQDRYFNQITFNNIEYSYHPSVLGQSAYATVINNAL